MSSQLFSLGEAGLAKVKADFVSAAERAMRIGFDLLELHMAAWPQAFPRRREAAD